jgi:hypothetical protein
MIQVVLPFMNSLKSGKRIGAVPGYRQKGETVQATRELEESTNTCSAEFISTVYQS